MVKRRSGASSSSSSGQRAAGTTIAGTSSQSSQTGAYATRSAPNDQLDLDLNLPAALRPQLRSTIALGSYIPSTALQFVALAYCIFVLPGRPASLLDTRQLLHQLVQDAPRTMQKIIAGMTVVQLYFGGQAKRWWDAAAATATATTSKSPPQGDDSRQADGATFSESTTAPRRGKPSVSKAVQSLKDKIDPLLETLVSLVSTAVIIFLAAILLGAPVARKIPETVYLSCFLSLLAFTPSLYALTSPFAFAPSLGKNRTLVRYTWIRLFSSFEPKTDVEVALLLPAYGTVLGCLLGAIPEGLDWEESWQTWPVPCLLGSFAGWTLGQLASLAILGLVWLSKASRQLSDRRTSIAGNGDAQVQRGSSGSTAPMRLDESTRGDATKMQ